METYTVTVYENGRLIRDMTFEQVRKNARG